MKRIIPVKLFETDDKYEFKGHKLWYDDMFPNVYGMRLVIEDFDLWNRANEIMFLRNDW